MVKAINLSLLIAAPQEKRIEENAPFTMVNKGPIINYNHESLKHPPTSKHSLFPNTLRCLEVPIMNKAYMFGDNKPVVTSSTIPQSILNKRHNMLSYHRVREAITANILEFHSCLSSQNRSDILRKHWDYMKVKGTIRELFDYQGDILLLKPD